eukprot:gene25932-11611_t
MPVPVPPVPLPLPRPNSGRCSGPTRPNSAQLGPTPDPGGSRLRVTRLFTLVPVFSLLSRRKELEVVIESTGSREGNTSLSGSAKSKDFLKWYQVGQRFSTATVDWKPRAQSASACLTQHPSTFCPSFPESTSRGQSLPASESLSVVSHASLGGATAASSGASPSSTPASSSLHSPPCNQSPSHVVASAFSRAAPIPDPLLDSSTTAAVLTHGVFLKPTPSSGIGLEGYTKACPSQSFPWLQLKSPSGTRKGEDGVGFNQPTNQPTNLQTEEPTYRRAVELSTRATAKTSSLSHGKLSDAFITEGHTNLQGAEPSTRATAESSLPDRKLPEASTALRDSGTSSTGPSSPEMMMLASAFAGEVDAMPCHDFLKLASHMSSETEHLISGSQGSKRSAARLTLDTIHLQDQAPLLPINTIQLGEDAAQSKVDQAKAAPAKAAHAARSTPNRATQSLLSTITGMPALLSPVTKSPAEILQEIAWLPQRELSIVAECWLEDAAYAPTACDANCGLHDQGYPSTSSLPLTRHAEFCVVDEACTSTACDVSCWVPDEGYPSTSCLPLTRHAEFCVVDEACTSTACDVSCGVCDEGPPSTSCHVSCGEEDEDEFMTAASFTSTQASFGWITGEDQDDDWLGAVFFTPPSSISGGDHGGVLPRGWEPPASPLPPSHPCGYGKKGSKRSNTGTKGCCDAGDGGATHSPQSLPVGPQRVAGLGSSRAASFNPQGGAGVSSLGSALELTANMLFGLNADAIIYMAEATTSGTFRTYESSARPPLMRHATGAQLLSTKCVGENRAQLPRGALPSPGAGPSPATQGQSPATQSLPASACYCQAGHARARGVSARLDMGTREVRLPTDRLTGPESPPQAPPGLPNSSTTSAPYDSRPQPPSSQSPPAYPPTRSQALSSPPSVTPADIAETVFGFQATLSMRSQGQDMPISLPGDFLIKDYSCNLPGATSYSTQTVLAVSLELPSADISSFCSSRPVIMSAAGRRLVQQEDVPSCQSASDLKEFTSRVEGAIKSLEGACAADFSMNTSTLVSVTSVDAATELGAPDCEDWAYNASLQLSASTTQFVTSEDCSVIELPSAQLTVQSDPLSLISPPSTTDYQEDGFPMWIIGLIVLLVVLLIPLSCLVVYFIRVYLIRKRKKVEDDKNKDKLSLSDNVAFEESENEEPAAAAEDEDEEDEVEEEDDGRSPRESNLDKLTLTHGGAILQRDTEVSLQRVTLPEDDLARFPVDNRNSSVVSWQGPVQEVRVSRPSSHNILIPDDSNPEETTAPPPPPKQSFWARLFGLGAKAKPPQVPDAMPPSAEESPRELAGLEAGDPSELDER